MTKRFSLAWLASIMLILGANFSTHAHAQSAEPASYDVLYGGMVVVPERSGGLADHFLTLAD